MRVNCVFLVLVLMALGGACGTTSEAPPEQEALAPPGEWMAVRFIDVGQGDAILIDKGAMEILIDGGPEGCSLVDKIKPYVDGPLECMVLTHPHADHTGCLDDVLQAFQVSNIWFGANSSGSASYRDFALAMNEEEDCTLKSVDVGDRLDMGAVTIDVLNPRSPSVGDMNNDSVVLYLKYNGVSLLFMGDAELEAEDMMLSDNLIPENVTVLKVGHHGSATSSSERLLQRTKPKVAVISVGAGNTYGHPNKDAVERLLGVDKLTLYRTDVNGMVTVRTEGVDWIVAGDRNNKFETGEG